MYQSKRDSVLLIAYLKKARNLFKLNKIVRGEMPERVLFQHEQRDGFYIKSLYIHANLYGGILGRIFDIIGISGGASPLFMTGHRQVISRISKGSQNTLLYHFIITTFDCQDGGISARAFALARPGAAPPLIDTCI